jgi:Leucine-rich repeat (LRR) protein
LSLDLSRNGSRDNGLAHLSYFVRLKELNLSRNSIRGSGLKHIETLTHLTSLDLSGNLIGSCDAL